MAKKSKTNQRKKKQAEVAQAAAPQGITRRGVMRGLGFGALGVVAAGGATYAGIDMYRDYIFEHDLTRIGKGTPAVVQVHDPQCSTCLALQNETRRAMKPFDADDLLYVVADITQPEGQVFARRHGVGHSTLVLMDGRGEVKQVLAGFRQRAELEPVLAAHFEAYQS